MYEELVGALRKRAMDLPEKFSRNAVNIDLLMKAAAAIEDLTNKVLQAENDSGLYDDLPMMVLSEAKEPPKEEH